MIERGYSCQPRFAQLPLCRAALDEAGQLLAAGIGPAAQLRTGAIDVACIGLAHQGAAAEGIVAHVEGKAHKGDALAI